MSDAAPGQYPEHEKLEQVQDRTQIVGDFFEFLDTQQIHLMAWCEWTEDVLDSDGMIVRVIRREDFVPIVGTGRDDLLARWAGVDRAALAAEKEAMLAEVRRNNAEA